MANYIGQNPNPNDLSVEEIATLPIAEGLKESAKRNWCTTMNCGTCGSPHMTVLLLGLPYLEWRSGWINRLTEERAKDVLDELSKVDMREESYLIATTDAAVMWLLYAIWNRFGEHAHRDLFPRLGHSWATEILDRMRVDYRRVLSEKAHHRKHFGG